jgi:hypothetical protein
MKTILKKVWLLFFIITTAIGVRGSKLIDEQGEKRILKEMIEVVDALHRLSFKIHHFNFERMKKVPGIRLIEEADAYEREKYDEYQSMLCVLQDDVFSTIKESEKKRLSGIRSWMDVNICINKKGDVINAEIVSGNALSEHLSKKTCRRILQKAHSMKFPPFDCKENDVYIQIQFCIYRHLFPNDNDLKKWPLYRER